MGEHIRLATFSPADALRFSRRVDACVAVLADLLARPRSTLEPLTLGAELELHLIDSAARPALAYEQVAAQARLTRVVPELTRYNLELNQTPTSLVGRPFAVLAAEIQSDLLRLRQAAAELGVRPLPIGILPTLVRADVRTAVLSSAQRYHALDRALRIARGGPQRIRIDGLEPLDILSNSMAIDGATAAFQVHLRIPLSDFVRTFNAAQLATPVALAISANSPMLLGHRLWQETRIPLIEQQLDDRPTNARTPLLPQRVLFGLGWLRQSPIELFAEVAALFAPLLPECADREPGEPTTAGQAPALRELRLHNSTVWRWNRPVYSDEGDGHLRIELRALPAGPSVPDMMAGAAFLVGLILGLAPEIDRLLPGIAFERVRANFYQAAENGLAAELAWPEPSGRSQRTVKAGHLAITLLPVARQGLLAAGVEAAEVDALLVPLGERIARGLTGASWQLATLRRLENRRTRSDALARLVEEYLDNVYSFEPLCRWPLSPHSPGTRAR